MKYPLFLSPSAKDYLWGGKNLKNKYGKTGSSDKIAETWELSCHKDGVSVIKNGEFSGIGLDAYIKKFGSSVLGTNCKEDELPLLTKFIDAEKSLSIQVHPSEEYAEKHENDHGKTELWYIADCCEGATVYFGFAKKTDKETFIKKSNDGTVTELLNKIAVQKGDIFLITSGIVHAIGAGITVAEIGTNSNITYRIYDFGRKDANGNPRELHVLKAADVIKIEQSEKSLLNENGMLDCKDFCIYKKDINGKKKFFCDEKSFMHILCLDGEGNIVFDGKKNAVQKGDSIFIPAGMGEFYLNGNIEAIITRV